MLGSGSALARRPRAGNEYLWENRPKVLTMLTLGLYARPWVKVTYPNLPSIGLYEAAFFEPDTWKPPYSNAAYDMARPDDLFWAARRVAAFSDAAIRRVVRAAQYSDPTAEAYLAQTLIRRRDKIARLWLNAVLPLVDCQVSLGAVACSNVAVDKKAAQPGGVYRFRWYRFDNQTDSLEPVGGESMSDVSRFNAPSGLLDANDFVAVEVRGLHPEHRGWATPTRIYLRRSAAGWQAVGVDRMPEQTTSGDQPAQRTRRVAAR
jgi:hypothetical protein